jgi:hypothetical protein
VLDDLNAPVRIVIDQAEEVLKIKPPTVDTELTRSGQFHDIFRLKSAEQFCDLLCECFRLTGHVGHGRTLSMVRKNTSSVLVRSEGRIVLRRPDASGIGNTKSPTMQNRPAMPVDVLVKANRGTSVQLSSSHPAQSRATASD